MRRRPHHLPGEVFKGVPRVVFLTVCTADRTPLFDNSLFAAEAARAAGSLHEGARTVYGYCVMPDHVHLLAATDGEALGRCVQLFKGRASRWLGLVGAEGSVWQRGYFDRVIRRSDGIIKTLEYLVLNPVRGGLVSDWWGYRWSGSPTFGVLDQGLFGDGMLEDVLWDDLQRRNPSGARADQVDLV